jgi:hypothetical protein
VQSRPVLGLICPTWLRHIGTLHDDVASRTRAITLRLEPQDYARREAEDRRLGFLPGNLTRVYVRSGLEGERAEVERRRMIGLPASDRLAELTIDLPPLDAVRIARESRDDLERRLTLS